MPEREKLTEITYVTDHDTGMYKLGEVDGLFQEQQLEYYLNMYGSEDLLRHLAFLTHQVIKADIARRSQETVCEAQGL